MTFTKEELNACYALLLHKQHGKSRNLDKAYRTISTRPLLSKALDLYSTLGSYMGTNGRHVKQRPNTKVKAAVMNWLHYLSQN